MLIDSARCLVVRVCVAEIGFECGFQVVCGDAGLSGPVDRVVSGGAPRSAQQYAAADIGRRLAALPGLQRARGGRLPETAVRRRPAGGAGRGRVGGDGDGGEGGGGGV